MNREIKFRAFADNKMYYNVEYTIDGWVHSWGDDGSNTKCEAVGSIFEGGILRKCELMQYTGLKDKNGKEIYEGDIVIIPTESCDPADQGGKDILEVVFMNGMFVLTQEDKPKWKPWMATLFDYEDDIEVIDNIYENPELLK
jgi:uncharacterized phage protein (TIGR01671 family)